MLLPLRGPDGLLIPTTAAGLRNAPARVPNPGGDLDTSLPNDPYTPFSTTQDVPKNIPGPQRPTPTSDPAGPIPGMSPDQLAQGPFGSADAQRMPPQQSTPRSDLLMPGMTVPGEPPQIAPPPLPGANEPLAPSPGGGTSASKGQPDARAMLRDMGQVLIRSTSPAERVQGMQMLFEASQPTPGEVANAERQRLVDVVDSATSVDPELQNAARIVAQLGGDARLITQSLGLDPESRRLERQQGKAATQKAQELVDSAYAPEYVKFRTGGGMRDAESNLNALRTAKQVLSTPGTDPTGPLIGRTPDSLLAMFPAGQRQITARELIETVGQRNLKEILGAQFAQKEGEQFLARVFNPKLSPEENLQRANRLMTSLERAYQDKRDAAEHFEANGTLKGFKGKLEYSLADFEQAVNQETKADTKTLREPVKVPKRPDLSNEAILQQAQEAIARGKNPKVIAERLRAWGVQPE